MKKKKFSCIFCNFLANDEGDFGASLELGLDLFSCGNIRLHKIILSLLINGYMMVKRPQYVAIIKSHLENRINTCDHLSILRP